MADLKTYSVVIQWNDRQRDEGTYGDTVRTVDGEKAERIVRARMLRNLWAEWEKIDKSMSKSDVAEMYATETLDGMQYFGTCHECTEGAIWKASELEQALRLALPALVACYGEPSPADNIPTENRAGREAILAARSILNEIDNL